MLCILQQLGDLRQIKLCVVSSQIAVWSHDPALLRVHSVPVIGSIGTITGVDLASNLVKKRLKGITFRSDSCLVRFW